METFFVTMSTEKIIGAGIHTLLDAFGIQVHAQYDDVKLVGIKLIVDRRLRGLGRGESLGRIAVFRSGRIQSFAANERGSAG